MKSKELSGHLFEIESLLCRRKLEPGMLKKIIHKDFFELGSSGKIWDKRSVINELKSHPFQKCIIKEFRLFELDKNIALVTYEAMVENKNSSSESLRSSIWKKF